MEGGGQQEGAVQRHPQGSRHQDRRSLQQAQRRHQGYRQGVSLTTPDIYEG